MKRLMLTLALAGVLSSSSAAFGQPRLEEPAVRNRAPLFEIGGSVSAVLPIVSEDGPAVVVGGGPRLTVNLAQWIGVELLAEALGPVEDSAIFGLYMAQVRIPLRNRSSGRTLALTAGAAGAASYQRIAETRIVRFDGSTVVHPGYRRFRSGAPNTVSVGLSGRHVMSRFASGIWDLQGLVGQIPGIAVRGSFGVSFGIGGAR